MSLDSKVIWSEGMFLNPQHFQQQDRYFERYIHGRCSAYGAYGWGVSELEIDQQLLPLGKVSLLHAKGVFPDGTPFSFPDVDDVPPVLEVPENTHNKIVYLAVPVKRAGAVEILPQESTRGLARYYSSEVSVRDVATDGGDNQPLEVGKLRLRLLLEGDDLSGYACIGVLKISESRDDKNVLLDDQYLPTCVDCKAAPKLTGFISELAGLLHHRAEAIAGRLADARRGGTAEIADYMMLQLINRLEPLTNHLAKMNGLHPVNLYAEALQMVGELSTFVAQEKRPPAFPEYLHDDLQTTFSPVMGSLRKCLSMVYEQTAVALSLVEKKYGIRVAEITDRSMLSTATYILAVRADVPEDVIRNRLPAQIKIGPVERIRQLVNAAMPGIPLKALPVAPRQIPFRSETTYFELEKQNAFWKELQNSGGFAVHVGGEFPGLEFEFWAIRQ
ncbi:type VI secretion system baseplate subunit TssK [Teredinibacter sp. KSP-S5-2]|uniref:type VI secretion system baseplate subunit TssK n=1 Tax=Teredinibacter sp. KSP-S5-2 TaxID=3034506 RepID=UPI002934649F|nr:type VI secretion system baseplate subunit TssK [Teredinibacter sp. KSP-S5-2]WNO08066.1 type VI secretion system baseplate subunit TssK [Teredinibacter sp. KSP-S5-2]